MKKPAEKITEGGAVRSLRSGYFPIAAGPVVLNEASAAVPPGWLTAGGMLKTQGFIWAASGRHSSTTTHLHCLTIREVLR